MSDTIDPRDVNVKSEDSEEATLSASTANLKVKATPKKRKATKNEAKDGGETEESPTKKSKPVTKQGIPDRLEDLSPEDRMLMHMKADGKTMKEIGEAWFVMTGAKHTSLSTRYNRIKAAIARVKDEDLQALREGMGEADIRIEEEKKQAEKKRYAIVAEVMEAKGTEKYDTATLEKAWKRLQAEGTPAANGSS
ncbi:hypothetical protein EG328_007374 [Venturia inaequalis]|uniref:Uncharacterized protein n=1 Tax=Venturia inaequalis TaxID=5025 RepID=A0A8H3VIV5_VENIN|nr:hypothetical protein EG328_007374 [Venturia inaequalis]